LKLGLIYIVTATSMVIQAKTTAAIPGMAIYHLV